MILNKFVFIKITKEGVLCYLVLLRRLYDMISCYQYCVHHIYTFLKISSIPKKKLSILHYYVHSLIPHYLPHNQQIMLTYFKNKTVFILYDSFFFMFKPIYIKYLKARKNSSLESQRICDHMFSDPRLDHTFHDFWLHTWLIFFLLVCGNFPLTLKKLKCWNPL